MGDKNSANFNGGSNLAPAGMSALGTFAFADAGADAKDKGDKDNTGKGSFIASDIGGGTQDTTTGLLVADIGGGTEDMVVEKKVKGAVKTKDAEELESTKALKARGTQGSGASGVFH